MLPTPVLRGAALVLLTAAVALWPARAADKFLGASGSRTTVTSSPNPSVAGQPVTFTVTVQELCLPDPMFPPSSGIVRCYGLTDGSITLRDGTTVIGNQAIGSNAFVVSGLAGGTHAITATYAGTAIGSVAGSQSAVLDQVVFGPPTFLAPSATGTGTITATIAGSGATCTFATASFLPSPPGSGPVPATAPNGVVFPHGLFDFTTTACTPGAAATFTVVYPTPIVQASYWKFGPTPSQTTPHWYTLPATIAGNTATFTIVDGGVGDDDLVANGVIVDQGGPGLTPSAVVPALSAVGLAALAFVLLAVAAWAWAQRHRAAR